MITSMKWSAINDNGSKCIPAVSDNIKRLMKVTFTTGPLHEIGHEISHFSHTYGSADQK